MRKRINKSIALVTACVTYMSIVAAPALAQGIIQNPLGTNDIKVILKAVITWSLGLAALLALLAIVWGGTRIIMNFGGEEGSKKGKTIIQWAIIGLIVIATSYVIVETVVVTWLGA